MRPDERRARETRMKRIVVMVAALLAALVAYLLAWPVPVEPVT